VVSVFALLTVGTDLARAERISPTGSMIQGRFDAMSARLPDGRILVAGGQTDRDSITATATAEIYDPATGTFTATGSLAQPRSSGIAKALANGKILIAGGIGDGFIFVPTAELFDPATGTFSPTGSPSTARFKPSSTILENGRVLVIGGVSSSLTRLATAEIYDPLTETFSPTGSMAVAREGAAIAPMASGNVLVAGGSDGPSVLSSAEIFDPGAGTFSPAASMGKSRFDGSATLLPDGRILLAGGFTPTSFVNMEIYDPLSAGFSDLTGPSVLIDASKSALMADGRVLVLGFFGSVFTFDPATNTQTVVRSNPGRPYTNNAGVLEALDSGEVLMAGGGNDASASDGLRRAELYDPAALPDPIAGKTVILKVLKGKVATRCKGGKKFKPLAGADQIEVGCEVDTRKGTVELTSATGKKNRTQSASFRSGVFKVSQKKGRPEVELALTGKLRCPKKAKGRSLFGTGFSSSATISNNSSSRKLWGKGKGNYKTKGSKGSATVRGTEWLTEDRCDGTTLFRVRSGVVMVRDFAKKKTIKLKAGKSYVAGKKRGR